MSNQPILEISRTTVPSFNSGTYKVPFKGGAKVRSASDGTLRVHFADDPVNVYRTIHLSGSNQWDSLEVIDEILDHSDTTIDLADLLIGAGKP